MKGARSRAPPVGALTSPPPPAATAAAMVATPPIMSPVRAPPESPERTPPPPAPPPPSGGGGAGGCSIAVVVVGASLVCSSIRHLVHLRAFAFPAVQRCFLAAFRARNLLSADIALHLAARFRPFTVFLGMRSPPEPLFFPCFLFRPPRWRAPAASWNASKRLKTPEILPPDGVKGNTNPPTRPPRRPGGQRGGSPCGSAYAPPPAAPASSLKKASCPWRGSQWGQTHPPAALRRSGVRSVAAAPAGLAAFHRTSPPPGVSLGQFPAPAGQRNTHPAHPGGALRGGRLRQPAAAALRASAPAGSAAPSPAFPPIPLAGGLIAAPRAPC